MKKLFTFCALLCVAPAFAAAPPGGRVDTRVLAGQKNLVVEETYRLNEPVFLITGNTYPHLITNTWEGQYFVNTNNVTIGLPNPTNNLARKFTFMAMGTNQFYVSNGAGGQLTIVSSNVVGPLCLIASNRMAMTWSTGTNWLLLP